MKHAPSLEICDSEAGGVENPAARLERAPPVRERAAEKRLLAVIFRAARHA